MKTRPGAGSTVGGPTRPAEQAALTRALAVDWSGDARAEDGVHEKLWLAEAVDGTLLRVEPSSRRAAMAEVRRVADRCADVVVGLDFAFSLPAWFLVDQGIADGPALWERVGELEWRRPPFHGWAGSRAAPSDRRFRQTEQVARRTGLPVKSVFQVGGAGAVGTGSRLGMPYLVDLRRTGLAVWPFDPDPAGSRPVVAEVYPRMFTGPVVKSRFVHRERVWDQRFGEGPARLRARALCCEDAFDAALTAVGLSTGITLVAPDDPVVAVEGWIAGVRPN